MKPIETLRRDFTTSLLQTGRQWRKIVDQALLASDISEATAAPLLWISRLGEGVRQTTLASYVGIENPSLVRLLDQLEASGLVVRKEDKLDRRAKTLWLTAKGEAFAVRLEKMLVALREQVLADVSREDLDAAMRVLAAFDRSNNSQGVEEPPKSEALPTP
jgi:MarR family transcriptional regulator, transcriptional regulator for hemolysin